MQIYMVLHLIRCNACAPPNQIFLQRSANFENWETHLKVHLTTLILFLINHIFALLMSLLHASTNIMQALDFTFLNSWICKQRFLPTQSDFSILNTLSYQKVESGNQWAKLAFLTSYEGIDVCIKVRKNQVSLCWMLLKKKYLTGYKRQ